MVLEEERELLLLVKEPSASLLELLEALVLGSCEGVVESLMGLRLRLEMRRRLLELGLGRDVII